MTLFKTPLTDLVNVFTTFGKYINDKNDTDFHKLKIHIYTDYIINLLEYGNFKITSPHDLGNIMSQIEDIILPNYKNIVNGDKIFECIKKVLLSISTLESTKNVITKFFDNNENSDTLSKIEYDIFIEDLDEDDGDSDYLPETEIEDYDGDDDDDDDDDEEEMEIIKKTDDFDYSKDNIPIGDHTEDESEYSNDSDFEPLL